MISRISLTNFQIHKKLTLVFSKGVNFLIGETDAGKSAVIRAINLALNNSPRGGEKLYKTDTADGPLEITIEDDEKGKITRKNRAYTINDNPNQLSAFRQERPKAITDIINVNYTNFQFQIDPHFLILETGGNAAKILNSISGLEDQTLIIDEIKKRIESSKRNIRELHADLEINNKKIKDLGYVPELFKKALSLKQDQLNLEELKNNLNDLEKIINNLEKLIKEVDSFQYLDKLKVCFENFLKVIISQSEQNSFIESFTKTIHSIEQTENVLKKYINYDNIKRKIDTFIKELKNKKELYTNIEELLNIITNSNLLDQKINGYDFEIDDLNLKFSDLMKLYGKCPLCGAIQKGECTC
jgi:DNA repair protein SbcC/Rad50